MSEANEVTRSVPYFTQLSNKGGKIMFDISILGPTLIAAAVLLIIIILMSGYVKASPDTAYIISGLKRNRRS